jgi:hypothetical protein
VLIFLVAFSLFNICAAGAAWNGIMNVDKMHGAKGWQSQRLYAISVVAAWGLLLISIWATAASWVFAPGGEPLVLLPVAWLLLSGTVFAVVDFAEDGVFDFGRGPSPDHKTQA